MNEPIHQTLIKLTQEILDSVAEGNWDTYVQLCDSTLSAFEPEAQGNLVEGMDFHKFYFDNLLVRSPVNTTMANPHVRMLGDDVAIVCYIRLVQKITTDGSAETYPFEETRIWQKQEGGWKHVHFHRSRPGD